MPPWGGSLASQNVEEIFAPPQAKIGLFINLDLERPIVEWCRFIANYADVIDGEISI